MLADFPAASAHLFTLRFTKPARFHFLHGGALHGLLCRALQTHPLPEGVIPFAPESGRVRFEPGDRYNLGLTLVGNARTLLPELRSGLARLGSTTTPSGAPPPLGGNFELVAHQEFPLPDPREEAALLANTAGPFTLRLVSPLRMSRPARLRQPGAAFFNADCFPAATFLSRLWGRLFRLAQGREPTQAERAALCPPLPDAALHGQGELFWLDLPLAATNHRRRNEAGMTLGGVVGWVRLPPLSQDWLPLLLLARHLHVGEGTSFGLGRFRIAASGLAPDPLRPARSLLEAIATRESLTRALAHVVGHSQAPGVDGIAPAQAAEQSQALVEELLAALQRGTYRPAPLLGVLLPKEGGKVRPLAVPTVRDRTLQRAACELLAPALDTLLEDSSFAYRKGLSRSAAAVAIQRAHDQGFSWVLDADIESFFDCVEHPRLFAKLQAFFPDEPLVPLLQAWVAAPVVFQGRTIPRHRGLPQGAVVSPLLANLYLDELDEELLQQGFRLVRYADDFVVLCRDPEEARAAQRAAQAALAKLGLKLAAAKTDIRSFDAGFSYLGYLFCRSLVVEKTKRPPDPREPLAEEFVPAASWLAQVPLENLRLTLTGKRSAPRRPSSQAAAQPEAWQGPPRRALYLTDPSAQAFLDKTTLVVASPAAGRQEWGLATLSHLVVLGRSNVTMPLFLALAQRGVPCFFVRRTGELYAQLTPFAPDWALWQAQAAKAADPAARLACARAVVQAKLHNTATLAVRHKLQGHGELAEELRELERRCLEQRELEPLRGLEGRGAARFFACLQASLPEEWGFAGRRRNPPPDPVNAMLSLAYTVLYNHVSTALVAAGLDPRIGFFHERRGAYHALASDLEEELRHLAEGYVLAVVRRRELSPGDFAPSTDGRYPVLLTHQARRRFLLGFEKRLLTPFTPPGAGEQLAYLEFIARQAAQLVAWVRGQVAAYEPLRLHA